MSVVNQFNVVQAICSSEHKTVYMLDEYMARCKFSYDINCLDKTSRYGDIHLFFDIRRKRVLILIPRRYSDRGYGCTITNFILNQDTPIISPHYHINMRSTIFNISDEFKHQYANYLLDNIVNDRP
jgi:hypothetical protein